MMRFAKPPTTYDEQLGLLISRGMRVDTTDRARHYLAHLMDIINPGHHWQQRLGALLLRHPGIRPAAIGFPEGWQELPLWRGKVCKENAFSLINPCC